MDNLNYNHLYYFWMVVREGSVSAASEKLLLAQPTVSAQLRKLEKGLGMQLLERVGRSLVPTESGQMVFEYADEIFSLGRDLMQAVAGKPSGRAVRFAVGVCDVWSKLVTFSILAPVFELENPVQLVCYEGKLESLLADMAAHRVDLVLSDIPLSPSNPVRGYNHLLGHSTISMFGTTELACRYAEGFPESLDNAPLLLPTTNTVLRRSLNQFFDAHNIRPRVIAEVEDSALLKTFGQAGRGIFPALSVIEKEVAVQYSVQSLGCIESIRESMYAILPEQKIRHPAVNAILDAAASDLSSLNHDQNHTAEES